MTALSKPSDLSGLVGNGVRQGKLQKAAENYRDNEDLNEVAEEAWEDFLEEEPQGDEYPIETLSDYVKQAFKDAQQARCTNGIDCKILEGRRMMKGEYTREELAKMPEIDVWFNLVSTISNITLAFLRSILSPDADNSLWELEHSPLPELPDFLAERAAEYAAFKVQAESFSPVLNPETGVEELPEPMTEARAVEIAEELREEIFDAIDRQAELQTNNLKREIDNVYELGNFYDVLDEFLDCIRQDPTACIKGPVISSKKIPEWEGGKKVYKKRKYQHYEAIDIADFFPSPDSRDPNTGSYVIHLKQMTRNDLMSAAKLKGFVKKNIETILCEFEDRSRDWLNPIEEATEELENRGGSWRDYEGVDVIEFHGRIPGHVLIHAEIENVKGLGTINPKDTYEMEIWMTCDRIIRIVPACNENGRPFHCASLYPCKGSIWGESIPHRAKDEQRAANAALRAAIRDMGYTSGPQTQIDVSLLDENQKVPKRMVAGTVIKTNSRKRGTGGKAMIIEQLQTQAPQFLALLNTFFLNAELNTGINRQMMGQAQPGVGTLGEANILQGNATTGLRSMLVPIDRVIESITEMTACQIMETTDDPMLKADARPKAKGSTHLLERQLNRGNLLQFINTVLPISAQQPGALEPFAIGCLMRELAKSHGLDPDKISPDPARVEQRNLELALTQPQLQGQSPGIAGGVAQPPAPQNINAAQPSLAA